MTETEEIGLESEIKIEDQDDLALVRRMQEGRDKIVAEIKKVIIGQEDIIDELLIALFGGGHVLVTGVPGLAKTLLRSSPSAGASRSLTAKPCALETAAA